MRPLTNNFVTNNKNHFGTKQIQQSKVNEKKGPLKVIPGVKSTWPSEKWMTVKYGKKPSANKDRKSKSSSKQNEHPNRPQEIIQSASAAIPILNPTDCASPANSPVQQNSIKMNKKRFQRVNEKRIPIDNARSQNKRRGDLLPESSFKTAKAMFAVIKSTHHLHQVMDNCARPKQITRHEKLLSVFPKPFANDENLQKEIKNIAQNWGKSLCLTLSQHYQRVRNETLNKLEGGPILEKELRDAALSLATKWTKNKLKKLSDLSLMEAMDLINCAIKKQRATIQENFGGQLLDDITEHEIELQEIQKPVDEEVQQQEIQEPVDEEVQQQEIQEPAEYEVLQQEIREPVECEDQEQDLGRNKGPILSLQNSCQNEILPISYALPKAGKIHWKLPKNEEATKWLITDEQFLGKVPNDFFHVTLPGCNLKDLVNLFNCFEVHSHISLILIHVGYSGILKDHYLRYMSTVIKKVTTQCENASVFFTNLISERHNSKINLFNKTCREKCPHNFIEINFDNVTFSNEVEKFEKIFQEWMSELLRLKGSQ
jgi:hypothetical protein